MELTVHEIQTNLDDLRHDVHCFQTELSIVDGKIRHHENALTTLKQKQLDKQQSKIDQLSAKISTYEEKLSYLEQMLQENFSDVKKLSSHAGEVSSALSQYKERITELEKEIISQNRKFEEITKIKSTIEQVAKSLKDDKKYSLLKTYKVKAGDSLEKIARKHDSNVEELKRINELKEDLIVVGQELKVPSP